MERLGQLPKQGENGGAMVPDLTSKFLNLSHC